MSTYRYIRVRLTSADASRVALSEIEVYETIGGSNVAINKSVTLSDGQGGFPEDDNGNLATNGNFTFALLPDVNVNQQCDLDIDLGAGNDIFPARVIVYNTDNGYYSSVLRITGVEIYGSSNGSSWDTLLSGGSGFPAVSSTSQNYDPSPVSGTDYTSSEADIATISDSVSTQLVSVLSLSLDDPVLVSDGPTTQYGTGSAGAFDPESGLTLTSSQSAGIWTLDTTAARSQNVVLAADVYFSSSPADGTLLEKGGSGQGTWIGIRDTGTVFRARSGDGAQQPPYLGDGTSNNNAAVYVDTTDFPTDNAYHTVVWEVQVNPGTARLWIDGELKGTAAISGGFSIEAGRWEGGAGGMFVTGGGSNVTGEPTGNWSGGDPSGTAQLRMYANQLVTAEPAGAPEAIIGELVTVSDVISLDLQEASGTAFTETPSDTASISDALSVAITRAISDTATVSDTEGKDVTTLKFDAASISDNVTPELLITSDQADTANISEALTVSATALKQDAATISDAVSFAVTRNLSDATTITDAEGKDITTERGDTTNVSDNASPELGIGGTDLTATEGDTANISDQASTAMVKSISDGIATSDDAAVSFGISVSDTTNISDQYADDSNNPTDYTQSESDTSNISDSVSFAYSIVIEETISTTDGAILSPSVVLQETASIADSPGKAFGTTLDDSATFSDAFNRVADFFLEYADVATLSENSDNIFSRANREFLRLAVSNIPFGNKAVYGMENGNRAVSTDKFKKDVASGFGGNKITKRKFK